MANDLLSNIEWHPESHIFLMDINVVCINPGRVCPLQAATGICVNYIMYVMDYFMCPLLGNPTVMGGWGAYMMFFMGVVWFVFVSTGPSICYSGFWFVYSFFIWGRS